MCEWSIRLRRATEWEEVGRSGNWWELVGTSGNRWVLTDRRTGLQNTCENLHQPHTFDSII